MCGRFASWSDKNTILKHYQLEEIPEFYSGYNIYPTTNILVARQTEKRELVNLHWGYLPRWCQDKSYETPNSWNHKILGKSRFYAESFRKRRCLIPVDGYYEWYEKSRPKQPFFIRVQDSELFSLAGLWDVWNTPQGPREGCAIIMTPATEILAPIHHSTPVIIKPEDYDEWLEQGGERFIATPSRMDYDYWPVSTRVNSPQNQGPEILDRIPWPSSVPQWAQ